MLAALLIGHITHKLRGKMAKLKNPTPKEGWMERVKREQKEFDEKHPILDTRYYVEEWRKAYTHWSDPYDDEVPAKLITTFGPFTKQQYDEFLATHEPDDGGGYEKHEFKTKVEHLRHYSYDKWGR